MEGKRWRKSTYSNGGEANCVELDLGKQGLLVRDSKGDLSVMLSFTDGAASAFRSAVKGGRFDR
jgi:hypothetical protein